MVNLEHDFPRERGSVTLKTFKELAFDAIRWSCFLTSPIISLFDFDSVQANTSSHCVNLISLGRSRETQAFFIQ